MLTLARITSSLNVVLTRTMNRKDYRLLSNLTRANTRDIKKNIDKEKSDQIGIDLEYRRLNDPRKTEERKKRKTKFSI